jgi:hypothetical protein
MLRLWQAGWWLAVGTSLLLGECRMEDGCGGKTADVPTMASLAGQAGTVHLAEALLQDARLA